MISIDYALRIYTDMVNAGETIDIEYFKKNLNEEDFIEFHELTPFVDIIKSTKDSERFQRVFQKVDEYKQNMFETPTAASFRSSVDADNDAARDLVNKIFDEEFPDE